MRTKGDAARVAVEAIASFRSQADEMESESRLIAEGRKATEAELRQVVEELVPRLLPDAAPARLEAVARETGAAFLPSERVKLEGQRGSRAARLQEVESEPDVCAQAVLLHPETGELGAGLRLAQDQARELGNTLTLFEHKSFRWLMNRQSPSSASALQGFWRAVTFADYREQKARQTLLVELDYPDWETLMAEYQRCTTEIGPANQRLSQLETRQRRLGKLLEEQNELQGWVYRFEEKAAEHLRGELEGHLSKTDKKALHDTIRPPLRLLVARQHGLQHKARYFEQMERFLSNQIRDRRSRAQKMDRVRLLWERNPWGSISGNKSKWLVTLPAMKAESAGKQLRWIRTMRKNIMDFQDWPAYQAYLAELGDFLPYDAFALGSSERMPYEGFTRAVLPDLDQHRRQKGLAKADYSELKKAAKRRDWEDGEAEIEMYDDGWSEDDWVDSEASESDSSNSDGPIGVDTAMTAAAVAIGVVAVSEAAGATDFVDLS